MVRLFLRPLGGFEVQGADPNWTLTSGPPDVHRPPQQLAPDRGTFTRTVTAVHQATSTLTALAAADYSQVRTAALTGRLLVPAVQVPASARNTEVYTRGPDRRANELLAAYRDAGTASVKASAKTESIIADHRGRDHQLASPSGRRVVGRLAPVAALALREPDPAPGAIERVLSELGVTEGELLDRGMALDTAAAQLVAEAADRTAPQRWHRAVTRPGVATNASAITRRVLATEQQSRPQLNRQYELARKRLIAMTNMNATPLDVTAARRTVRGTRPSARDLGHHAAYLRTAGELWARVQAAEKEAQAARERYEAFGVLDSTSEGSPEFEQANDASHVAWVRAEEARHDLDAFLNPERYAKNGYRAEALDELRAEAEAELEIEAGR